MNRADCSVSCDDRRGAIRARRLVLALVLGLLGVLLMIMTANAYVAKKTQDSLLDFDRGTFFYTGLLDIPDDDIHSVQLLPIGLTGKMTATHSLPLSLTNLAAVANGDVIYVVGGIDSKPEARVEVYSAIITGTQGEIAPWQTANALPAARVGAGIAVHPGTGDTSTLYVVGGLNSNFEPTDTIYRAQVTDTTGEFIEDWTADAQSLPQPLYYASAIEHGDALYVIGGSDGAQAFDTVYRYPIMSDGSLGSVSATSPLTVPLFNGFTIVYADDTAVTTDTVYYVGGSYIGPGMKVLPSEQVYFADFLPGGGLTEWRRSAGALPRPTYGHSGVLINQGAIIATGGIAQRLDQSETYTSSVKSALVDPEDPSFRLYDWCRGLKPPVCTIGAWQTGDILPEVRALHGTVEGHGYFYVIGGQDDFQKPQKSVFVGTLNESDAWYAADGWYKSEEIDLEQAATLRQLNWHTTIEYPGQMGMSMRYQTKVEGEQWSGWSMPQVGATLTNVLIPEELPTNIRYVQYEVNFTTTITNASPLLNWVEIYYEVDDPDVAVTKTTEVTSAQLSSPLEYTIRFTNTGDWVAENVVLTETLPEYTTYDGDSSWQQVDTRVYTQTVGDLERGAHGSTTFRVKVDKEVPKGVDTITNRIDIDYPPMIDALGVSISDPITIDNSAELETPLALSALTVTKDAMPAPESIVTPGSSITYTLGYENMGRIGVSGAVLTDTFDHRESYTITEMSREPDLGGNVWYLGTLTPSSEGEITVSVKLADRLPNHWPVTNLADLSSPAGGSYQAAVTHTVMNGHFSGSEFVPDPIVDLAITDVHWMPAEPAIGEWPTIFATIVNRGTADAQDPFWVELYIKPSPSDPPERPKDHDRGYCLGDCSAPPYRRRYVEQVINGLAKNGSTVVRFENLHEDPSPDFPGEGAYDVYVQVDVSFSDPAYHPYWGFYPEDYESNNLWEGSLLISQSRMYLPVIFRKAP